MSLNVSSVEDSIVKYKAYLSILLVDNDLESYVNGDVRNSKKHLDKNMYLDLYIYVLDYSLDWFENDALSEEAPITDEELSDLIDKANELISSIELPLNL